MRRQKRFSPGLRDAAREGFLLGLKARALREGAFPLALRAGGITESQLQAWAAGNGLAYANGILAVDRRVARPTRPAIATAACPPTHPEVPAHHLAL
jgi:hypothetical protein